MAKKKDSLGQRRPEPPPYKDGDFTTRYNNVSEFKTVVFDAGSFLYVWDILYRHYKNNADKTYITPELRSAIERAEMALEDQAQEYIPIDVPAKKSERGGSGKKLRCPDCGTKKPKKVLKKGRPMWKCLDCERRWPREVPGEAPRKPVEASAADSPTSDPPERPRKRQKPAKKKRKKSKVA